RARIRVLYLKFEHRVDVFGIKGIQEGEDIFGRALRGWDISNMES
ncbi:unnamed protein product, partial [Allacma fusca]